MKQYEAVIEVMRENGGFATLGYLNQAVLKVMGVEWKTKTPFASIRRIVQDERFFFKIKPGLWALKSHREKLPATIQSSQTKSKLERCEFDHTYFQGLLVEVGNLKKYQTFVPNQDKNKNFLGKKLGDIATVKLFYKFGYENIVQKAQTVDVTWFNPRKMPSMLFEVEHSTDIQNSLLKFLELQDYNSNFFIVANNVRKKEYESKMGLSAFTPIQKRVAFLGYEQLSDWHARAHEITAVEGKIIPR